MLTDITVVLFEMLQWQLLSPLCFAHVTAHSFDLPSPAVLARMFCTWATKIKSLIHICVAQFFKCLEGVGGAYMYILSGCIQLIFTQLLVVLQKKSRLFAILNSIYRCPVQCEYDNPTFLVTACLFF